MKSLLKQENPTPSSSQKKKGRKRVIIESKIKNFSAGGIEVGKPHSEFAPQKKCEKKAKTEPKIIFFFLRGHRGGGETRWQWRACFKLAIALEM